MSTETAILANETKKANNIAYLDWYIQTRPENVPLTDEDIQAEVNAVRYSKNI